MQGRTVRLHDLLARDVVARAESTKVGNVTDFFFSPRDGSLGMVLIETSGGFGGLARGRSWVRADNVLAIGSDAMIVRDHASAVADDEQVDRSGLVSAADVKGKTVVTDQGERIGKVVDFDLVAEEGRIASYVIAEGGGGTFNLGLSQQRRPERIIPVQPDVVIGPELITIPAGVLRQARRHTATEGGLEFDRRSQADERIAGDGEPFTGGREEP